METIKYWRLNASFNSTLVRLNPAKTTMDEIMQKSFNSTLVRLNLPLVYRGVVYKNCFNSTLVRLNPKLRLQQTPPQAQFQFHTGTIKPLYPRQTLSGHQ